MFDANLDPPHREAVLDFLTWATHDGQRLAAQKNYASLLGSIVLIVEAIRQRLRSPARPARHRAGRPPFRASPSVTRRTPRR